MLTSSAGARDQDVLKMANLFVCPDKQATPTPPLPLAKPLSAAQVDTVVWKERILMWKITLFVFVFLSSCHILVLIVSFSVCFLLIVSLFHFILLFLSVFLFLLPLYLFFGFFYSPSSACRLKLFFLASLLFHEPCPTSGYLHFSACMSTHTVYYASVWLLSWSRAKALVRLFKSCPMIAVHTKRQDLSKSLAVSAVVCVHWVHTQQDKDGHHAHHTLPSFVIQEYLSTGGTVCKRV